MNLNHQEKVGFQFTNLSQQSPTDVQYDNDQATQNIFCPVWKKSQPLKPCQKYGLDPQKLEIEELMKFRSYRRLYNIVANDQTQPDQIFRPNLIKQLYFLLQITPFIEDSLKQLFLNKIQELYNSNDHKKIQLSKNLDGKVKNALLSKSKSDLAFKKSSLRPKSGVQWDKTLSSFLRPYTAKIRSHKNSQYAPRSRPESSKYGVSTNAVTNELDGQSEKIQGQNEEVDKNLNLQQFEQICDIEEEWQRSLDFKKKYRTLHPEEEPTYEKLMGIIQVFKQKLDNQPEQRRPQSIQSYKSQKNMQKKRKIQSALMQRQKQNAKALVEQQLNIGNQQNKEQQDQANAEIINDDGQRDDDNSSNNDTEEDAQNDANLVGDKKVFTSDRRTRQGRIIYSKSKDKLHSNLNGIKILRPFTAKQNHVLNRLDQYSSLEQNKRVIDGNLDEQCAEKYRDFMRKKNIIKRQSIRKSEAKRYMNNFMDVVKVLPNKKNVKLLSEQLLKNKQTCEIKDKIKTENKQNLIALKTVKEPQPMEKQQEDNCEELFGKNNKQVAIKGKIFDFSHNFNCNLTPTAKNTYNVKNYFENIKNNEIAISSRGLHRLDIEPHLQDPKTCSKMTYVKRIYSEEKFDPLHKNNLENYNKEALQEVQKIKNRLGGKLVASTDSLMKALYVDGPLPSINQDNLLKSENQAQQFQIPDKRYLMIQKQEKKKKKRKLKKVVKKSSSSSKKKY